MRKLHDFSMKVLWGMVTLLFAGLALLNMRYTAFIDLDTESVFRELVEYRWDSLPGFLLFLTAEVLFCLLLFKVLEKVPLLYVQLGMTALTAIVCWQWMGCSGYLYGNDQRQIFEAAQHIMVNDFSDIETGGYLFRFPYQLGLVAFVELLYRIFGDGSAAFNWFNLGATVGTYWFLCRIAERLFENDKEDGNLGTGAAALHAVLMAFCLPGILFAPFQYGNTGGTFFAVLAMYLVLRGEKGSKLICYSFACLAMAVSIQLKAFNMVFMIALIIFFLVKALGTKDWRPLVWAMAMLVMWVAADNGLKAIYENRAGREWPEGHPMVLTIAMGMQSNWEGWRASGWYNMYNYTVYEETGFDAEESAKQAKDYIRNRLVTFQNDPAKFVKIYKEKTLSQWTEPTYQSLWLCYDWDHAEKYSERMLELYTGQSGERLFRYMKWYQTATWTLAALGLWAKRKELGMPQLLPALVILGGFLFSLLWEGKSQYCLPYFLLATVYAALGMWWTVKRLTEKHIFAK